MTNRKPWIVLFLYLVTSLPITNYCFAQDSDEPKDPAPGLNSSLVSSLKFRGIGPALMSGRILDIAVDPVKRSTWYIATVGGVWKTSNAGVTWKPIFEGEGSYSIGCIAIDPNDRFTVWVGTGENNSQRSVGYGDGLYKSTDGGSSFKKVGLENSEHIGKIIVHPDDGNTVYVAAQGPLWKEGGDRGLYKTTDGGKTWDRILHISEHTGINEVHMDPADPDTLYASAYQRRRHQWVLIDGGPESGIHKSTDGGESWKKINRGLPGGDKGRIGMAVSPINHEVIYALVEAASDKSGFYRSANRGETWQRMGDYISTSPQYYQEIVACPHKFDRVYSLDTYMQVTEDGGKSFSPIGEANKHVDNHALVIDPADADHLIVGCDGGVYETWDRGKTYDFKSNLPITQFYKVAVSNEKPFYYVYGGTQDNATQGGPSRTNNTHGIRNSDWFITAFGDGFDPAVDPEDSDTIYSQWQYGGLVRYNRKTGERVDIRPQLEKDGTPNRWNWDSALLISPHSNTRVYYGSQRLYRTEDRGDSWKAISDDLSRNVDRNKLKVMGRVWGPDAVAKNMSTSMYGTIVSVSESPITEDQIYVGTDDGVFSVTTDGGENWKKHETFGTLDIPEFAYINDIEADVHDSDTVYVAINNHKRGDFKPYIVMSKDRGETWVEITGDLPERGSVYCLKQDHENPNLLFCGTEFGCYFTIDEGKKWIRLKSGLPTVAIRDMEIQAEENDLVLASFGRGFYILDDYSPLREISEETSNENKFFPIKKGLMYAQASPLAGSGKAYQGASFFVAPNPAYGVTFTYHLNKSLKTKKSERISKNSKMASDGKSVFYPSWDKFKAEDREQSPKVWLTIRDMKGDVVTRIQGSTSKGMHRAQWNFRHAGTRGRGPIAVPGTYTVEINQMAMSKPEKDGDEEDGDEEVSAAPMMKVTTVVEPVEFEIEPLTFGDTSEPDREAILEFVKKARNLSKTVSAANQIATKAQEQIDSIESVIKRSAELDSEMQIELRAVEEKLMDVREKFNGDPTKSRRNEAAYPGFMSRLNTMMQGAMGSTTGPTETHKAQYDIVLEEYEEVLDDLKAILDEDLPGINEKLDEAGASWTPGRGIPELQNN